MPQENKEEKCMVEIPTYDDDGTEKDSDYWFICLKNKPCPVHSPQPIESLAIGSKETKVIFPQTPDSWVEEFDAMILSAGFEDSVEEKRKIWLDFIRTQLDLARSAGRRETIEEMIRNRKEKMDFYDKERKKHLDNDNVLLSYDFDSRYVATKHHLEELLSLLK